MNSSSSSNKFPASNSFNISTPNLCSQIKICNQDIISNNSTTCKPPCNSKKINYKGEIMDIPMVNQIVHRNKEQDKKEEEECNPIPNNYNPSKINS